MKIYIILSLIYLLPLSVLAQIGIYTESPKGLLHIDAGKDNQAIITPAQESNDLIVSQKGYMGVGTSSSPDYRLSVNRGAIPLQNSGLILDDGSQKDGYVLTSDSQGRGRWKVKSPGTVADINFSSVIPRMNVGESFKTSGSYVNLQPGKWIVTVTQYVSVENRPVASGDPKFWLVSSWTEALGSTALSNDIVGDAFYISGLVFAYLPNNLISGSVIIHNKTNTSKKYYYMAKINNINAPATCYVQNFGGSYGQECNIYAIKLLD